MLSIALTSLSIIFLLPVFNTLIWGEQIGILAHVVIATVEGGGSSAEVRGNSAIICLN
jgi:hypothetical protein